MSWPLISCFTCFSACRTQITLLPCFTGHFVKLCYLYKSFEVFDWWYYKVQSVNVSTQNIVYYFITSKYNCIHTHSISPPPPPPQGMPLKNSLLLKMIFWYKKLRTSNTNGQKLHPFSDYQFFRKDKQLSSHFCCNTISWEYFFAESEWSIKPQISIMSCNCLFN